jgi:hypothetical protein
MADEIARAVYEAARPYVQPGAVAFYAIPLSERLVLRFNVGGMAGQRLDPRFVDQVRERMGGRKVLETRGRANYLQIAYQPGAATPASGAALLESVQLDLGQQPSPYHVPVGMTNSGPFWLSMLDMDSVIIGGARRMGKTNTLHGWVQALIHGGMVELVLWDGKGGLEFGRYAEMPNVQVVTNEIELDQVLMRVHGEAQRRQGPLAAAGVTNLMDYLRQAKHEHMRPIVLVLDELANLSETTANALSMIVRTDGAYGVHPVVGIQRPDSEVMRGQLKANLATAIALPVVSGEDSRIILHRSGAEKLPKVKGRLLMVWEGRLVEAQAFRVTLPTPRAITRSQEATTSLLSAEETEMVAAALDPELDGYFNIQTIAFMTGISDKRVKTVARAWAERGWLSEIRYDRDVNPPKRLGRRVTDELKKLAGLDF